MKIIRNILFIVIPALCLFSCTSDQCVTDTESYLTLEVNVVATNLINIHFLDSMSVYSPSWSDSIHYSEETGKNFRLTFNPDSDSSVFIITSKQEPETDTLIFVYKKEIHFLSPECGFAYHFSIDTASSTHTENLIDSVKYTNNELTTDKDGYFKIYL